MGVLYIVLFCFSILLWQLNKRAASLFCFILFLEKGLYIIPQELGGIKLTHLAFGYIVVIITLNYRQIKFFSKKHQNVVVRLLLLISFFVSSIIFSIFYYGFPPALCITTGLRYFVLLSFFVFPLAKIGEYNRLIKWLFYVTFATAILYIGQCILGIQLLSYNLEHSGYAVHNGLFRWYNFPPFGEFFMYFAFFMPGVIPKKFRLLSTIVFPLAIILSNSRGFIFTSGLNLFIISYLTGNLKKNLKMLIGVILLVVITSGYLFSRMENEGKTSKDIELIIAGDFSQAEYDSRGGLTLLYRFAWIKERFNYLEKRPFVEMLYGLGMITDESKAAKQTYRFRYGLVNKENGTTYQIRTPDIAWGNFLTCYGVLGTVLFFIFYFSLWKSIRTYSEDVLSKILESYMLVLLLMSFTGSSISEPYNMSPIFLWYSMILRNSNKLKHYNYESRTHRVRIG